MPYSRPLDGLTRVTVSSFRLPETSTPKTRRRAPKRLGWRAMVLYGAIAVYTYIIVGPYLPGLFFAPHIVSAQPLPSSQPVKALAAIPFASPTPSPTPIPGPNTLKVDSIGVDGQIYEGATEATLSKGIWHIPNTSTPDKGGNTVLAAHRFMYLRGGNTFYSLDKVKVGDTIQVIWDGKLYTYQVFDSEVVSNRQVDIENNTPDPIVTLFTCTPLWTSAKRLVVKAHLVAS